MLKELRQTKERKEHRWGDFTSFIVNEIELDHDIAYCKLEHYKNGEAFNEEDDSKIFYGFSEGEVWDQLFKITECDSYEILEEQFLNCRWCNWENALVFELKNNGRYMALKL